MGKSLAKCQVIEITLLIENPVRFAAVVGQPLLVYFNHPRPRVEQVTRALVYTHALHGQMSVNH
jgi:hypothetical protein